MDNHFLIDGGGVKMACALPVMSSLIWHNEVFDRRGKISENDV